MINPKFKEGQKVVFIGHLIKVENLSLVEIESISTKTKEGKTVVKYSFKNSNFRDMEENEIISLEEVPSKLLEIQQEEIKKILENGLKVLEKIEKIKQEVK